MKSFHQWLTEQKNRDCLVGDLAKDAIRDIKFPKNVASLSDILSYLKSKHAALEAIEAAAEGWFEFLGQNNRGQDIVNAIRDGVRFGYQCGFDAANEGDDCDPDSVITERFTEMFE